MFVESSSGLPWNVAENVWPASTSIRTNCRPAMDITNASRPVHNPAARTALVEAMKANAQGSSNDWDSALKPQAHNPLPCLFSTRAYFLGYCHM